MIYSARYQVRSYEISTSREVSALSICNYLQEAAGNHARTLGIAVQDLNEHNLTWVLCRLYLRMHAYPVWGTSVLIETWPVTFNRLYAIRDFLLMNQSGEIIGAATTSWMVLCLTSRRPVPLPSFVKQIRVPDRPRSLSS